MSNCRERYLAALKPKVRKVEVDESEFFFRRLSLNESERISKEAPEAKDEGARLIAYIVAHTLVDEEGKAVFRWPEDAGLLLDEAATDLMAELFQEGLASIGHGKNQLDEAKKN